MESSVARLFIDSVVLIKIRNRHGYIKGKLLDVSRYDLILLEGKHKSAYDLRSIVTIKETEG